MSQLPVEGASCDTGKKASKGGNLCPAVAMYGPCNVEDLKPGKTMKWCTCGLSKTQPWCDGAHKKTGFKSLKWKVPDHPQRIYSICACKHTKNPPFCDATHVNLPTVVTERQKNCKSAHEKDMKLCTGCGWVPKW
ncbi:hypothetical protein ACROYT_G002426 [Oculina patagonica]